MNVETKDLQRAAEVVDSLCCLSRGYLKHAEPQRALGILLLAMHMGPPSRRLLLLLMKCFLSLDNSEQTLAVSERYVKEFEEDKLVSFFRARCQHINPEREQQGLVKAKIL